MLVTACTHAPAPVARSGPAGAKAEAPAAPTSPSPASSPGAPVSARLAGDALRADVLVLRRAYEGLHPGLYRYSTRAEMDAAFDALDAELAGGATLAEAYRALAIFAAKVRCGHTFLNPTNQKKAVQEELFDRPPRLPFHFRWLDGRMVVTEALARDLPLVPGTEVVAIDGTASSAILARLLTVSRADGGNDAKRVANLERLGHDRYEGFDVAFSLFFPKTDDTFALDVVDPDGTRRSLVARGVRGAAAGRGDTGLAREAAKDAPLWSLRYLDARTAYLAMPTWVTYATRWDWKEDLRRGFADLAAKRATALVVDLRGNEGGEDVGNVILGHLLDRPLRVDALARWTRYRRVPDDLRASLHTWDASFFDWGDAAIPRGDGFYRLTRFDDDPGGDVLAPIAPRARLKLVVIVDGSNSSATFQFDAIVQRQRLGRLVGEPTGGNQRGINGGAFFFLELPASALELDLPLIARFPADGRTDALPDAGLVPDVVARPTAKDIAAGRDVALEAARRVAAEQELGVRAPGSRLR